MSRPAEPDRAALASPATARAIVKDWGERPFAEISGLSVTWPVTVTLSVDVWLSDLAVPPRLWTA